MSSTLEVRDEIERLKSINKDLYEALEAIMKCDTDAGAYEQIENHRWVLAKAKDTLPFKK